MIAWLRRWFEAKATHEVGRTAADLMSAHGEEAAKAQASARARTAFAEGAMDEGSFWNDVYCEICRRGEREGSVSVLSAEISRE